jgi:hypothetical protein
MAAATVLVPPLIAPHNKPAPAPHDATGATGAAGAAGATPLGGAGPVTPASPTAGPSAPARFTPITIQAEDPGNRLSGGAAVVDCATCHGGHRVRYLCPTCTLVVRATLPGSGLRTVTVGYEVDGPRAIKVSINGAPARTWNVTGPDWTTPQSFRFTAELPAGELLLTLYNDEAPTPDVDDIVIS